MILSLVEDKNFSNLISPHCNLQFGPWVAGGSVRKVWQGKPWNKQDIDFFCNGNTQFKRLQESIDSIGSVESVYKTDRAHTYTIRLKDTRNSSVFDVFSIDLQEGNANQEFKIQLICNRWYESAYSVINQFDFCVAQFITDGFTILTTPQAIEDCKTNKLNINPTHVGEIKPLRVLKYSAYGFEVDFNVYKSAIKSILTGGLDDTAEY